MREKILFELRLLRAALITLGKALEEAFLAFPARVLISLIQSVQKLLQSMVIVVKNLYKSSIIKPVSNSLSKNTASLKRKHRKSQK